MPTLSVRWDDFESAFIIGSPDARYFLNLKTGETEYTSHMDGETVKNRILSKVEAGDYLEIPRVNIDDALDEIMSFIDAQESETAKRLRDGMTQHSSPFLGFNRAMEATVSYAPIGQDTANRVLSGVSISFVRNMIWRSTTSDSERFRMCR